MTAPAHHRHPQMLYLTPPRSKVQLTPERSQASAIVSDTPRLQQTDTQQHAHTNDTKVHMAWLQPTEPMTDNKLKLEPQNAHRPADSLEETVLELAQSLRQIELLRTHHSASIQREQTLHQAVIDLQRSLQGIQQELGACQARLMLLEPTLQASWHREVAHQQYAHTLQSELADSHLHQTKLRQELTACRELINHLQTSQHTLQNPAETPRAKHEVLANGKPVQPASASAPSAGSNATDSTPKAAGSWTDMY